jgi:DNA-binding CsgD family transcriptional regulator
MLVITPAERDVLQQLANGTTIEGIADALGISVCEADATISGLFARLGSATRTEALDVASRRGLVVPPSVRKPSSIVDSPRDGVFEPHIQTDRARASAASE